MYVYLYHNNSDKELNFIEIFYMWSQATFPALITYVATEW